MELLIPFMLFILDWEGDTPKLTRHPVVYENQQTCEAAATDMMLARHGTMGEPRFWCTPLPDREEFDHLMQKIEADHVARREARGADGGRPEPRPKP